MIPFQTLRNGLMMPICPFYILFIWRVNCKTLSERGKNLALMPCSLIKIEMGKAGKVQSVAAAQMSEISLNLLSQ